MAKGDQGRMRLARTLRQLRQDAGLKQSDLASRLGRPQSYVSKYESGLRKLELTELQEISAALGSSLPELISLWEKAER